MREEEENLKKIKDGKIPPPNGELTLEIDIEPVSQGSNSKTKEILKKALIKECEKYAFLLSGDIQVEIQWFVHERFRYEYHKAPDVDNIIKPILDALNGPDAILIDDTQIQYVGCSWQDWTSDEHRLVIKLKFDPEVFVRKDALIFIEFDRKLCIPFNQSRGKAEIQGFVAVVNQMFDQQKKLESGGADYYTARLVLPLQRYFHKNKLGRYKIINNKDV